MILYANTEARLGSFFNRIITSLMRFTSTESSALSCESSTILQTRCHELSFSKSASIASSFSCSSDLFFDILLSRLDSRWSWKFFMASSAAAMNSAFLAFSASLRSIKTLCHSSFHFCIGDGPDGTTGSSSSASSTCPVSTGGASRTIGASDGVSSIVPTNGSSDGGTAKWSVAGSAKSVSDGGASPKRIGASSSGGVAKSSMVAVCSL
mmetsp:Transcript_12218/g.18745  ORF Transcript_12218/g.18745 Transcript_12218/m.18745 type:complete len:209 (-) Transcript_12218:68-694(-)